ncbi:hypothetical protein MUA19_00340 [Staphylococcus chromogenes]|uniref:exotoxin beta-grasp domain-containing protein n=1 Tax=Staphylococcus chromogenes TaxID=46126 RepID=UPI0021D1AA6F|nr:exotoxin beta-grasp domain-containing protein [Staphylococcus chromogenes]UXS67917.1 hypothetical protein MUA19_00340 [Staphylococcus chromogenes]
MKLSTIAKTTLALGILTTGVITTNAQSVSANSNPPSSQIKVNPENKFLYEYYQRPYYEYKKVSVFKKGNKAFLRSKGRLTNILLSGDEKNAYANGKVHNLDVFTVQEEGNSRVHYSVGGLSRTNFTNQPNWSINVPINYYKSNDTARSETSHQLKLDKQQVTLKELDFKLRNKFIVEDELYTNGFKYGEIEIKMKNGQRHVIDLTQALAYKKMGVLISPEYIDHIDVHVKKFLY